MKLTIIPIDGAVYKDGLSYINLTLNTPSDVHALQWNNGAGHNEYVDNIKPVEPIDALPDWANQALAVWQNAYDTEQALKAKQAAEVDALPATL